MSGLKAFKLAIGLMASGITFHCLPARAETIQPKTDDSPYAFHTHHNQDVWHVHPLASQAIDQILIRNWTSLNNKNRTNWGKQISNLALNLASSKASNYVAKTIQKYPFVLGASINFDARTEGTTNIGGDVLFKIADFGLKDDGSRDGLAFLHTKYTGSLESDSTWNAGLGVRHLIGEDMLAGINGYWDYRTTSYGTWHGRYGIGGELFWKTLSLTNNWYIPATGTRTVTINSTEFFEKVVPGWDIELGYRLPSNPKFAVFARAFRWDYQERSDNTGIQAKVSYQMTPHVRLDSWISNEIPANITEANTGLREDVVVGLNFTLSARPVLYKKSNIKQILQQQMVKPVRRRYDVLLERWATNSTFTNTVGGA